MDSSRAIDWYNPGLRLLPPSSLIVSTHFGAIESGMYVCKVAGEQAPLTGQVAWKLKRSLRKVHVCYCVDTARKSLPKYGLRFSSLQAVRQSLDDLQVAPAFSIDAHISVAFPPTCNPEE